MHIVVIPVIIIIFLHSTVNAGCVRTNDQKNYTCSNFRFYQLRSSPNQKEKILRSTIQNCQEEEIPEKVLPFQNLEYLTISCATINVVNKNAFANLQLLRELNLANNAISDFPNDIFESQQELQKLNLSENNFVTIQQNLFKGLRQLTSLSLSHNKLSDFDMNSLREITQIKELFLHNNEISFLPLKMFHALKQLVRLHLSHNKIETVEGIFMWMYELKYLNLSHNVIKSALSQNLHNTQLEILDLSFNELTVIYEDSFPLQTLEELHLQNNKIHIIEIKGVDHFPLKELDVRNNRLVFLEDEFITKATSLETLQVENNPWDCKCFERMALLRGNFSLDLSQPYRDGEEPICVTESADTCNLHRDKLNRYYEILARYWTLR
ncbi:hypothetical protein PPYR_01278 [Photinus pyralis]|nr:hypothetical protein PPYR_01278 [Photinus pyralis]